MSKFFELQLVLWFDMLQDPQRQFDKFCKLLRGEYVGT